MERVTQQDNMADSRRVVERFDRGDRRGLDTRGDMGARGGRMDDRRDMRDIGGRRDDRNNTGMNDRGGRDQRYFYSFCIQVIYKMSFEIFIKHYESIIS